MKLYLLARAVIFLIVVMSGSSLSPVPAEYQSDALELPPLIPPRNMLPLRVQLPDSTSILFTKGLFYRTLLETIPARIQYQCLQTDCSYIPSQPLKSQTTSNLWKHLKKMHPSIYAEYEKISSSTIRSSSTPSAPASAFFQPRQAPSNAPSSSKYRELLLSFVVSNNLPLRLVESHSFRQLVHHLNLAVLTVSRTTVRRDLYRLFCYHKARL